MGTSGESALCATLHRGFTMASHPPFPALANCLTNSTSWGEQVAGLHELVAGWGGV